MLSHPEQMARSRYNQSFTSSIFEPTPSPRGQGFVPAGKRRDQTTSEMFGNYDEKDLRGMPKTFVPKGDAFTAQDKKKQFLASDVLPRSHHKEKDAPSTGSEAGYVHQMRPAFDPYAEEEQVDANLRRQEELKSKLFGRETPGQTPGQNQERPHERTRRLMPNDFKWHNIPEEKGGHPQAQELTHGDRAYQEKCSGLFDHRSPQMRENWMESQRQMQQEDHQGEMRRKNNVYYSDLFGRAADAADPNAEIRRSRTGGNAEERIIVHQDWTDSKTELMHARSPRPEQPYLRKSDELHQARIFGDGGRSAFQPAERVQPLTYDNSNKLKEATGRPTQQIHQAHLRTSMTSEDFYEDAENCKHWEVKELHLSGLGIHADDSYVRSLCTGFDLQLVKVVAEVDPVRNLCKGRAKVMVRYNPRRDGVSDLVRKLEASRVKVEM